MEAQSDWTTKISKLRVMNSAIDDINRNLPKLGKVKMQTVIDIKSAINEIVDITEKDSRYTELNPQALALKEKFEEIASKIVYENPGGGRLMTRKYCKKTPCKKMGFTQKASCRPWKNCYRKSKK
jgi:hypothetical protein